MITILNKKEDIKIENNINQLGFTTSKSSEPVYPLKDITSLVNVPTLILSQKLMNQIFVYHSLVGGKEWSGPLIYSREGCDSVQELYKDSDNKTMELKGIEFLLADIGTAGGTEYELEDPEILNDLMEYQLNGYHAALIHTHHSMDTFFSGTDNAELQNNTPKHKMYLSLIVNYLNGGKPIARLCYKGTEKTPISTIVGNKLFNKKGKEFNDELYFEETFIYYIDLQVQFELDEKSIKRYNTLKDKQNIKVNHKSNRQFNYGDDFDWKTSRNWSRKEFIHNKNSQLGLFEDDDIFPTNRWNDGDAFGIENDIIEEASDIVVNDFKISKFLAAIFTLDFNLSTTNIVENNKLILSNLDEIESYDLKDEEQLFNNLDNLSEYFAEIIFEEAIDMEIDMPIILQHSITYLNKFRKNKKAVGIFENYKRYLSTMNNIIN